MCPAIAGSTWRVSVDRPGSASPYIGSHTLRVLEFSGVPVMEEVPRREAPWSWKAESPSAVLPPRR